MPDAERVSVLGAPFPRALRVRRHDEAERREPVGVLLTLDDVDGRGRIRREQLGEAVENAGGVAQPPDVPAPAVGPALRELLRLEPDGLEEERARLVAILVGLDDPGLASLRGRRREEVGHRHPDLRDVVQPVQPRG